ncbi:hypothetical protein [[Limnothrix rosea] IAM M-220]|uniref:hypothetical protein n=1 Tax=[Limnothrix rosea] IAM M-220 TaxID=454133 RepID=UPI001115824A|nr:hypothetical protein [[Limnothrix rosea] IAM M-220]
MKTGFVTVGIWLAMGFVSSGMQALPWQSNRTTIQDLENLCRGDRQLEQVKTEFGNRVYSGTINLARVFKTSGCEAGDRLEGKFTVMGIGQTRCEGDITIEFVDQYTANLEWDIVNAKNQANCPVRHTFWQTQVTRSDAPQTDTGF